MSEYIELDKVHEECQGDCLYCPFNRQNDSGDYCSLKELPSIEIVRCKDCKNKIENQGEAWICGHPSNNAWNITPEHFCSYGERSE